MGLSYTTISSRTPSSQGHVQHPETPSQYQYQPATRDSQKHTTGWLDQRVPGTKKDSPAGWKPYTMRAPVLCAVIVISLGLAGVIEYLAQKSQRQGGLGLSPSEDDIPQTVNIAYLYMPTTVAVLYSLLWTWIDLDVRRMQPWFELSRATGARGDQSLLLNYPFEFLAFVPVTAWKRRHWPVFNAGLVMMLVFWAITPLQGAIFGRQAVVLTRSVDMSISSGFMPVEEQAAALDASILNAAYGITWYEQDLPEFTTAEYALLPFSPTETDTLGVNETWTFNTTRFKTDLECWSATYIENIATVGGGQYEFDNGQGCLQNISIGGGTADLYNLQYIGWKGDAHLDWALHSEQCGTEFSHQFLTIAGQETGSGTEKKFGNLTAMFCEPSYMQQEVSIAVDAATGQPLNESLVELASWKQLDDTTFNRSAFEFLLHAGFSSVVVARDYPDNLILDQFAKLYDTNISWPTTNMVGFAIGLHNGSIADFVNTTVVRQSYAAAHKLIFSSAVSQLVLQTSDSGAGDGLVKYTMYGIVVSRPISVAVESLLFVVALLAAILFYTIVRSVSRLTSDPDSVASLFDMFQKEELILSRFSDKDNLSEDALQASICKDRYHLEQSNTTAGPTLRLLSAEPEAIDSDDRAATMTVSSSKTRYIRPKELRSAVGILFILILAAAVGILAYFKRQEISMHGLVRPSQNSEVLQILENYIPMVFSTLLEPFLTLLNRLLCVLQPYYDLQNGERSPRSTIETKYGSLPPQLIIWRALRAGHYFLALLSVVVLLANVLAVGLGAIFDESLITLSTPMNVTSLMSPIISRDAVVPSGVLGNSPYFDHFYMVQTNMSADTRLPPWIDTQFAYLPFADLNAKYNKSSQYNALTRGFGFEATCSLLPQSNASRSHVEYQFNVSTDLGNQAIKVFHEDTPHGNSTTCEPYSFVYYSVPEGKSAQEIYTPLQRAAEETDTAEVAAFCESRILLGWMRYDSAKPHLAPNTTFLECTTQMVSAQFNLTVDENGRILRSEKIGEYNNITELLGSNATSILMSANLRIGDVDRQSSGGLDLLAWHNNSLTTDWMNYYLKLSHGTRDYVDPNKDLPDATSLIPAVENIYQRIGAALLGANRDLFVDSANRTPALSATILTQETRIFMDTTAVIISITILGIYLLVGIVFYARQRKILLPRMPTTIGSTVAFVAASRAVRLYRGPEKKSDPEETYSFGRYVGVDGRTHIGIELDPFVVPINPRPSWSGTGMWHRRRHSEAASALANNEPS